MNRGQRSLAFQFLAKCLKSKKRRDAFKNKRQPQHYIIPCWIGMHGWMLQVRHAFVNRHAAAQRKDESRHYEWPKIQFLAVTKRMFGIRRLTAFSQADQQQ